MQDRIELEKRRTEILKSALLSIREHELSIGYPPCDSETVELIDRALMEVERLK